MTSGTVTREDFVAAAVALLGERLGEAAARDAAGKVMDYFGFDDTVIDNSVSSADRDYFYMFEEAGMITTLDDEATVEKGKRWRIHYWVINKDKVRRYASQESVEENPDSVYKEWDDSWTH